MPILQDHQHRTLARQGLDLAKERIERSLPTLVRREAKHWVAAIVRKRQHLGKKRRILNRGRGLREDSVELVELRLRRVVVRQSSGTFHLASNRIEGAIDPGSRWDR
jgi:hypothetical protein